MLGLGCTLWVGPGVNRGFQFWASVFAGSIQFVDSVSEVSASIKVVVQHVKNHKVIN